MNYKEAYYFLFNQVTNAIEALKTAQIKCEDILTEEEIMSITEWREKKKDRNDDGHSGRG